MSYNGKAFTYHNQLASSDNDLDKRSDWFTVACCPPNIMRLLGQIGGYIWDSQTRDAEAPIVVAHLFVSSTFQLPIRDANTSISQTTQWPWEDKIQFAIDGSTPFALKVRIPGWAEVYTMEPECPEAVVDNGYLTLPRKWLTSNKRFSLTIPMKPRWVAPPIQTGQDIVALARGPVIYCVEDFDNDWAQEHFKARSFVPNTPREAIY
jgi:uncharacterized protein